MDFLHKKSGQRFTERMVLDATGIKIGSEVKDYIERGFYPIHLVMPDYNPCLYNLQPENELTFHEDHYEQKFSLAPIDMEFAKVKLLALVNAECESSIKELVSSYPDMEIASFDKQEAEARSILAGKEPETSLLKSLAMNRGIELQELCRRVVVKADEFAIASGIVFGQRQRMEDAINAATSFSDLTKVDVKYALPWK